jgi:hypothetical protein
MADHRRNADDMRDELELLLVIVIGLMSLIAIGLQ